MSSNITFESPLINQKKHAHYCAPFVIVRISIRECYNPNEIVRKHILLRFGKETDMLSVFIFTNIFQNLRFEIEIYIVVSNGMCLIKKGFDKAQAV